MRGQRRAHASKKPPLLGSREVMSGIAGQDDIVGARCLQRVILQAGEHVGLEQRDLEACPGQFVSGLRDHWLA